jgi:membrane protein
MIIAAFTFVYMFMPNTRVRLRSAFAGALVAGILWQSTGWAFATFVAGSSQHTAVYSAFAGLVLFVIWVYVGWLILLIGASLAFYHQNPEYLRLGPHAAALSPREQEALALMIVERVGAQQYGGKSALTAESLVRELRVPAVHVTSTLLSLQRGGVLAQTGDAVARLVPARPLDLTSLGDVIAAARAGRGDGVVSSQLERFPTVAAAMATSDGAVRQALGETLAKALIERVAPAAA